MHLLETGGTYIQELLGQGSLKVAEIYMHIRKKLLQIL